LLPAEHRARVVWHFVEGLDLGPLYAAVQAVEGHAGRPAIDPAILMTLWLYATLEGVGSARAVARRCEEHDAYRWVCGGVAVTVHDGARRCERGRCSADVIQRFGRRRHPHGARPRS
jgi:transposase